MLLTCAAVLALGLSVRCGISARHEIDRYEHTLELDLELRRTLDRVIEIQGTWTALQDAVPPTGTLAKLRDTSDLERRFGKLDSLLLGRARARSELAFLEGEVDSFLAIARERILLRYDALASRSIGAEERAAGELAAANRLSDEEGRRFAAVTDRVLRLQTMNAPSLGPVRRTAFRLVLALLGTLLVFTTAVAWLRSREIELRKRLHGALLSEEMLESYSRRLELMNEQLEEANLLKVQFLANTSRELRGPLNSMIGCLQLLDDADGPTKEEGAELRAQALRAGEQLTDLTQNLVDLCRLEEGRFSVRRRAIESGPLLERSLARIRAGIESRGLTLLVVPPAEGWPRVQTDSQRLREVLDHLLENAVEFTEAGSIRISGRLVQDHAPMLRIEIADTGAGIDAETLPRLFEMFARGGSEGRGSGLGLTLCRHLIRAMRGEIAIESEGVGHGTRVWFTVPLSQPSDQDDVDLPERAAWTDACPLPAPASRRHLAA